jgi:nicotinic acid mononucleotide adenylyltransferase
MKCQILENLQLENQWKAFWQGQKAFITISSLGKIVSLPKNFALLAGSFNPLHQGHQKLAQTVEDLIKEPVIFELSIANVDKPWLDQATVIKRISQFINYKSLIISKSATFMEKTNLFGGCNYILGYDTALRVLSPKYYKDEQTMNECLNNIVKVGGKFLVAARSQNNELKTLKDLSLPKELAPYFIEIPINLFRMDISSTTLRDQGVIL